MKPGPFAEPAVDSKSTMDKATEAISRYFWISKRIGPWGTIKAGTLLH